MTHGTITLQHQHGPEIRDLTEARMDVLWMPSESADRELDCEIALSFAASNRPCKGQMSRAGFTPISGEFRIQAHDFSEDEFVGSRFSIPRADDAAGDESPAQLYHFEHLEPDDVEVEVLGLEDGRYHIRIRAMCELDTYGDSGSRSEIVIDGWFAWSDEEETDD